MNFYRYEARDKGGTLIQGTVQASTPGDVQTDLTNRGLRLVKIDQLGGQSNPAPVYSPILTPPTQAPAPISRPSQNANPYATPAPSAPRMTPHLNTPKVARPIIRTKIGTDKQRFFLFSQLGAAFRAGINASDAFSQVSRRSSEQFAQSLQVAANAATEGIAISDVFAQFPDLYPDHVVGLTRAGEEAGFLPEAFDEIARQAESAHAFHRWFFWIWFLVINTLLTVPFAMVSSDAIWRDWQNSEKAGGGLGPLLHEMWMSMLWPWGPITLLTYGILWGFRRWMSSRPSQDFRNKLGLKMPIYGKRAMQENLARFSWTLSRVSRIGLSPARSWELASASVPNTEFQSRLRQVGGALSGQEKMSDLFFRSKLFPDEYAPMIASAEYTGDYSGALEKLSQFSANEFVSAQNYAKLRSAGFGCLFAFAVGAFVMGSVLYVMDNKIPKSIMDDMDNQ